MENEIWYNCCSDNGPVYYPATDGVDVLVVNKKGNERVLNTISFAYGNVTIWCDGCDDDLGGFKPFKWRMIKNFK